MPGMGWSGKLFDKTPNPPPEPEKYIKKREARKFNQARALEKKHDPDASKGDGRCEYNNIQDFKERQQRRADMLEAWAGDGAGNDAAKCTEKSRPSFACRRLKRRPQSRRRMCRKGNCRRGQARISRLSMMVTRIPLVMDLD